MTKLSAYVMLSVQLLLAVSVLLYSSSADYRSLRNYIELGRCPIIDSNPYGTYLTFVSTKLVTNGGTYFKDDLVLILSCFKNYFSVIFLT